MFLKNYTPFKVWWYKEPLGETAVLFLLYHLFASSHLLSKWHNKEASLL